MTFIPLHDLTPRIRITWPWVTWGLILVCALIFFGQRTAGALAGDNLIFGLGLIPATLTGEATLNPQFHAVAPPLTLFSYMFLHGGWLHLGTNMLFLWIFGGSIEDALGHRRFLSFYLLGGVIAGLIQVLLDPSSLNPTIGASGAIAAVLGAYLILHPRARIMLISPLRLPAVLLLLLWIGFQLYTVVGAPDPHVASWAHIGGFAAGTLLIALFRHDGLSLFRPGPRPSGAGLQSGERRPAGSSG